MENYEVSFPTHVTSSLDIEPCAFKHAVGRIFNLRQPDFYDRNLNFGGAFAEALYLARKNYYINQTSKREAEDSAEDYVDSIFAVEFAKAMSERQKAGKSEEKIKTPDRLVNLLKLYWRKFPLDKEDIAPFVLNDSFSAEQALHLQIAENLFISVKPDMLAISEQGFSTILDEKTVGNLFKETSWPEYVYMMRPQFLLYTYVLNSLIEDGKLDIPEITTFEVRRAIIDASVKSTNDFCHPLKFAINKELYNRYFNSFQKDLILRRYKLKEFEEKMLILSEASSLEELTPGQAINLLERRDYIENFFPKDLNQCYMYGKPCPLIEHCSVGRKLTFLGFKPSKVNTITKDITFFNL